MTKREVIYKTIAHEPTEFVPYSFDMTSKIWAAVKKWLTDNNKFADDGLIGDYFQFVGPGTPARYVTEYVGENLSKDEFGCIWHNSSKEREIGDCGSLYKPVLDKPSLKGYDFPDGAAPGRFDHINAESVTSQGKYVVLGITGLLDTCWRMRGFENFLCDIADDENNFREEILDLSMEFICDILKATPSCVDGVRFCEDWGLQNGLVMSPALWRKLMKPRLKKMYDTARTHGLNVLIHTCGDITEIFPDIIEIGVEVVNPIQPEVMDIHRIKREYGKYLTFYGGMGCQSTLPFGMVQDVIDEVKDRIRTIGKDGGYILGPAGAISCDAKPENVFKLVELCINGLKY